MRDIAIDIAGVLSGALVAILFFNYFGWPNGWLAWATFAAFFLLTSYVLEKRWR